MSTLLLALYLLAPQQSPATPPREPAEIVRAVMDEALGSEHAFETLTELVAAAPHRLAGSEGAAKAVAWAKAHMEAEGLENVRLEPCTVPVWVRGTVASLTRIDSEAARLPSFAVLALGPSVATPPEGLTAGVVEVTSFEELHALGERAKGKFVFFNRPMDRDQPTTFAAYGGAVDQRVQGAVEAAKAGGVGAIVRSMSTRIDDFPHTGSMRYDDALPKVPAVAISTLGAERLSALIRAGGEPRLELRLDCKSLPDAPSSNVVGEIVGREKPEEIVLLGGHLDAWDVGEGAHDDGAGCAHTIEALRILKKLGLRPRRTLRAVLFMNEENGLRGARAYGDAHKAEFDRHVLAIESDRGGFAPTGFAVTASADAMERLKLLAALLADYGAGALTPDGGGADVSVLGRGGVPIGELIPENARYFDFHHCMNDTLAAVNPRELALGAGALAAFLYLVADLPEGLPRAK